MILFKQGSVYGSRHLIIISFILSLISFPLFSQDTGKDCNKCHSMNQFSYFEPDLKALRSFTVNPKEFQASVHGELECVACHKDTQSYPHKENREKVGCNQDCHSTKEGQTYTHSKVFTEFSDSIHNKGKKGKSEDSPTCVSCHGVTSVHKISKVTKKISDSEKISQCITCHDNKEMMHRNEVESSAVESYRKSFHYKAIKFGGVSSATCQDCHGVHGVLPKDHPDSSISDFKVGETCAKSGCHEGANLNFAMSGANHLNFRVEKEPILYYEEKMFQILTGGTMGMLVVGIVLDVQKKFGWLSVLVKIGKLFYYFLLLLVSMIVFLLGLVRKL